MTISFLGHSSISCKEKAETVVKEQLLNIIREDEHITCYNGGYGEFDDICARVCRELKKIHPHIELVYVTPYIRLSDQIKIKEMQDMGMCDSSIYPPIEKVPFKFAISKRNEWMVCNSDIIIAYVNRRHGGAYKSLQIAKRKKKKIVNIVDFLI